MIITMVILLIGAVLGLITSYKLFRWDVLGLCAVLAFVAYGTRRYYWGTIFLTFGILFNPIAPFSLDRSTWIFLDIVLMGVLTSWFWDYYTSYHKGLLFERYVQNKFPDTEWTMVNSTKDLHKKLRRFVESDANPDFTFRRKISKNEIAVECKYRSDYVKGTRGDLGVWWKKEQGNRYAKYGEQNNMPVYVAFGIGGNPKSPETVAYVPIGVLQKQYPQFIPKEIFKYYLSIPIA